MPEEFIFNSGALIDERSPEEKQKDSSIEEIVAAVAPVNWVEKEEKDWRKFPDQNQDGSYSCVMQTIRKLGGILLYLKEKTYVTFSAAFYQLRSNKPEGGMNGMEAFEIWKNNGLPLEQLVPSENMNDAQMDAINVEQYEKDIAKVFSISDSIGIPAADFETVASVIQQTGKGVMVWFYFTAEEWSKLIPTVIDQNLTIQNGLRHSVTAVDYFLMGGKKYLLVEDSAHFAGLTRHLISEEFFKARNWFSRYPMNFKFCECAEKPKYTFTKSLTYGIMNDADVVALQNILKYECLFPANTDSTGNYLALTAKGVYDWQVKHEVAALTELDELQGRRVGEKTINKLNELYGS